jgi:uncharacterized caspase-like protein
MRAPPLALFCVRREFGEYQGMQRVVRICLLLAMALALPTPALAKRVALIIANGTYANATSLKNPPSDARLIAASLKRAGFDSVDVKIDLGKSALETALQTFGDKAQGADVALVYYAGHGIEAGGQNYLIPTDARLARDRDLEIEATRLDTLLLMGEGARMRIIVLDACRNNPFIASMQRTLRNRAVGRGLAAVEPEGETLVVYAAKAGATAADGEGANSPFAEAMAKRVTQPGLEISLLFRAVRDDVLAKTGRAQEPFTYGSLSGQAFYFLPPNGQPQTQVATGPTQPAIAPTISRETAEALYWQGTVSANNEEAYRDYLARYPQGQFAGVAKANVQRFAKPKPQPQPPVGNNVASRPPAAIVNNAPATQFGFSNFAGLLGQGAKLPQGSSVSPQGYAFSPSQPLRRQITANFIGELKKGNEFVGTFFETMTNTQNMFTLLEPEYRKYGMSTNNLADTLVGFLGILGSAAQGDESDSPQSHMTAARNQVALMLSLDPKVQAMTAAERQTASDGLVLYTGFVVTLYATAKSGGPQALRDFQTSIADLSKTTLGIDAKNLVLGASGFQLKGQ